MMDGTSDPGCDQTDADYLETIALLQDEIARLEEELLAREEIGPSSAQTDRSRADPGDPDELPNRQELDRLGADLAARDETINLLLDQLRLVEEAESASRVEWEQLTQWVAEVEQRIERQDGAGTEKLALELDAHRKQAEECRLQLDLERTAWIDQRRGLENEIHRLQSLLAARPRKALQPVTTRRSRSSSPRTNACDSSVRITTRPSSPRPDRGAKRWKWHDARSRRSAENVISSRMRETASAANTRSPSPRCALKSPGRP